MPEPIENKDDLFDEDQKPAGQPDSDDTDEDLFDDEEGEGEEQKPAPKAPAPQPQDAEKLAKAIERKAVALDREKQRRKELEAEIARLKGTNPDAPAAPAPMVDAEAIARKVREDLVKEANDQKEKAYEESLKAQIKELPNMTKELAKEILSMAKGIPSRADAAKSVSYAYGWVMQGHNPNFSTTPAPIGNWMSSAPIRNTGSATEGQKELGKLMGVTPEEVDKLTGPTPSIFKR